MKDKYVTPYLDLMKKLYEKPSLIEQEIPEQLLKYIIFAIAEREFRDQYYNGDKPEIIAIKKKQEIKDGN